MNKLWGIILLLWAASCTMHEGYNQFVPIKENGWTSGEVVHFKPTMNDSLSLFDISILVRHTEQYSYQDLWLLVAYKEEFDVRFDTLRLMLADEQGRWKGVGSGTIHTFSYPYKTAVRFEKGGHCSVSIKQTMKDNYLKGILNLGLNIQKSN